jgi:hypothetical protein
MTALVAVPRDRTFADARGVGSAQREWHGGGEGNPLTTIANGVARAEVSALHGGRLPCSD